jgi:hypothetical protein
MAKALQVAKQQAVTYILEKVWRSEGESCRGTGHDGLKNYRGNDDWHWVLVSTVVTYFCRA